MGIMGSKKRHEVKPKGRGGKGGGISDKDRAVLDLKNARDRLTKYQKRLVIESDKLQEDAKMFIKVGNKNRALLMLKLKKYKIEEADKVDGQLLSVMKMIEDIEWETQQVAVFKALADGNSALKRLHEEMPLSRIEQIMEDTEDAMEVESEINSILAGGLVHFDDEQLEAELKELEELEDLEQLSLPAVPSVPVLPAVPTHAVNIVTEEDKNEEKRILA